MTFVQFSLRLPQRHINLAKKAAAIGTSQNKVIFVAFLPFTVEWLFTGWRNCLHDSLLKGNFERFEFIDYIFGLFCHLQTTNFSSLCTMPKSSRRVWQFSTGSCVCRPTRPWCLRVQSLRCLCFKVKNKRSRSKSVCTSKYVVKYVVCAVAILCSLGLNWRVRST